MLVQCDPSIKAIISKINEENGHAFIQEDIDDETVLIHNKKLDELKARLKDVRNSFGSTYRFKTRLTRNFRP